VRRTLIEIILCLAICSIAATAYGQHTSDDGPQPPPAVFFKLGLSGVTGDSQNVYAMAGGKILQYDISSMSLQRTVDLPDIAGPPKAPPPPAADSGNHRPPPPPQSHGLWASGNSLYVLAGPFIYVYSVPDLTLQNTVQLPKPELP